jgi:hypothetical protein
VEKLTSPQFEKLFAHSNAQAQIAAAADWFWSVRGTKLTVKQRDLILAFWNRALEWANMQPQMPRGVLAHLGRLTVHLRRLGAQAAQLLGAVAPYVGTDFDFQVFVEELARLAPENPAEAARILGLSLGAAKPTYDVDNHLKTLLQYLADHGQRPTVLNYVNELLNTLPGMQDFFKELSANH